MDVKETNTILRYKRPSDSWLCPDCDTENNISLGKCTVCGCIKSPSATILKQWNEADDRPVTPPKETPNPAPSGPVLKDVDKDAYVPVKEGKNKIIWGGIVAIIIFILLMIGITQGSNATYYNDAMQEYNNGNYEVAMDMFEDLPSSYKDVSFMLDESKYQCAITYLSSGDFTSAESLFESISYYDDTEEKLNECKYQSACSLFDSENYAEAKRKFLEISSYSNSAEMAKECDYIVAISYKNNGEYVKAMKAFNDLGTYKDSSSQFTKTENALISSNRRNSFFVNERSAFGTWEDGNGNYVKYVNEGNGSSHTYYSLSSSDGTYYKLEYGIHYKGDDYNWKKQWIYQKIDSNKVQVYNYIDGMIYTLSKK